MNSIKALLGIAIVVFGVYAGFKIAPVWMNNMALEDAMKTEARFAGPNSTITEEDLRDRLMKKVNENEMPLKREQIKIRREGNNVMIWAHYEVPIDLSITQFTMKFDPGTEKRPPDAPTP